MMKASRLVLATVLVLSSISALAEETKLGIKNIPTDSDTSILIQKGRPAGGIYRDYEVEAGSEEIAGEPVAGAKESLASWKQACAEWKKDMREMNQGQLLSLSCGTPKGTKDQNLLMTQTSTGTYKIKVKVRDSASAKSEKAESAPVAPASPSVPETKPESATQ